MPTPPYTTEVAALLSALETSLSGTLTNSSRAASDLRNDLEPIASGTTKFQLRAYQTGLSANPDSAESDVPLLGVIVDVHHRLAGGERDYTEGTMTHELTTLMDPGYWRSIPEVRSVEEAPGLSTGDVVRTGNVISYSFSVFLATNIF